MSIEMVVIGALGQKNTDTGGVKDGKELAKLLPSFRHIEDHSLAEGMAEFIPIFKLLKKIKPVSNISNKIVVMEK